MKKVTITFTIFLSLLSANDLTSKKGFVGEELVKTSTNYNSHENVEKKGIKIYNIFPRERLKPQVVLDNKNGAILINQGFAGFVRF
ncbi:MAG: hypothetical protein HXX81_04750 [Campylobacterales bacterium]|nr:hypothetical protein [Campylobacterales bacterium]